MKKKQSPFLEQVRKAIRVRHYSIRTEQAYLDWTKRFILYHRKRHPRDMGETEVCAFLTHLAVDHNVAASTQNQALNALVFVYKSVLESPLGDIVGAVRAKKTPEAAGSTDTGRGEAGARGAKRPPLDGLLPALRIWTAANGMYPAAGAGFRFQSPPGD